MMQNGTDQGLVLPPLNTRTESALSEGMGVSVNDALGSEANHVNEENERVHDGEIEWIPVHIIVPRLNSAMWSHYLGCEPELSSVRCKHCGKVIDRVNPETHRRVNKLVVSHLKLHGVGPTDDYYATVAPPTAGLPHSSPGMSSLASTDDEGSDSELPGEDEFQLDQQGPEQQQEAEEEQEQEQEQEVEESPEPKMDYSTTQLLALVVAAQNLPLAFVSDPSMRMLLGRTSDTHSIDASDVLATVKKTSRQIAALIERTAARNNVDMQIFISSTENDLHSRLKAHLNALKQTTFFGMTNYVWDHTTSLLTLQFYDPLSRTVKSMPLAVDRARTNDDLEVATLHGQLLQAFKTNPSLHKSVLSVTLPRERRMKVVGLEDNDWFANIKTPMSSYHPCIVSLLVDMLGPLFGRQDHDGTHTVQYKEKLQERCTRNMRAPGARVLDEDLDKIVSIDDINPSGTIFDKINTFYDKIYSNPWELSRFDETVARLLGNDPVQMVYFDPTHYSTAEVCLENFLILQEVITETQGHTRTSFSNIDYLIVKNELELIKSMNKVLLYFASAKPLSLVFAISAVVAIEKHLNATLHTVQLKRLWKPFTRVLNSIGQLRNSLINDDMILVAMFLCPSALFEREVLEYAFKSVSLSEIVNMVGEKIQGLVKRFVCVQEIEVASEQGENRESADMVLNDGGDSDFDDLDQPASKRRRTTSTPDLDHNDINMNSFRTNNMTLQREIDSILLHFTQENLYDYLSTVNSVVPLSYVSFCEKTQIMRENGLFKRRVRVPTSEDESGFKEENINYIDQLMEIHIPVCEAFWREYLTAGAGSVLQIVINMIRAQASSAIRPEYGFLKDFVPELGEDYLEDVVRLKLFSEQFVAGKVDFEMDTLPSACSYT